MRVRALLANVGLLVPVVALTAWFLGWDHVRWLAFAFLLLYPAARWSELLDQLSTLKGQVRALEEQNRALRQELANAGIAASGLPESPPAFDGFDSD